jgi:hypothetical protein
MTPQEKPERPRLRDGVHYLETPFRARVRMMIEHVARQEAREEVKRRLRAQGVKLSLTSAMTITQLANAHLRAHEAELLAQAERSGAVQRLLAHTRRVRQAGLSPCATEAFALAFAAGTTSGTTN